MSLLAGIALFIVGLILVVFFAEKLVEGAVGTALGFGVSVFLISVIFLGFDPENLAVGVAGSFEGVAGIALGSIIGAAMVAIALAFGITALIAPMTFEQVSKSVLVVPIVAVLLLGGLSLDGQLSRIDGAILLGGFVVAILYLVWLSRRGLDIEPGGEVAESLEEAGEENRWRSLGLFVISLVAIAVGGEMLVRGSEVLIARSGLSDTFFGMTILALLVSVEELARELPAALKGRPDVSFGNVVGSILAFFLFNAGVIALVRPVGVNSTVLTFYLPVALVTTLVISGLMLMRSIPRWAGGLLVILYLVFTIGGYVLS